MKKTIYVLLFVVVLCVIFKSVIFKPSINGTILDGATRTPIENITVVRETRIAYPSIHGTSGQRVRVKTTESTRDGSFYFPSYFIFKYPWATLREDVLANPHNTNGNWIYDENDNQIEINQNTNYEAKLMDSSQILLEKVSNIPINSFSDCISNGGKDLTPNYNAPKKCVLDNEIYEEDCVDNDKYFIIENNSIDSVGADHLVKYKNNRDDNFDCKYVVAKGDFEIKNEWAEYTLGLENNLLILDSGTGTDPRGLIIYNLDLRKKVYEDLYSEPVDIKNNTISYWTEATEKATKANCPKLEEYEGYGGSAAIETHVSLDLSTFLKKDLGEHRCSYQQ